MTIELATISELKKISQGHINGFPSYLLRWSKVVSVHKRIEFCNEQARAIPYEINSEEYNALQLFLSSKGNGLFVESPSCEKMMTATVIKNSIELIGNTPMLHVKNIDTGLCNLYLKLEFFNLGGSVKDRPAKNMIEKAEKKTIY